MQQLIFGIQCLRPCAGHLHLGRQRERHRGETEADNRRMERPRVHFRQLQEPRRAAASRRLDERDHIADGGLADDPRLAHEQQVDETLSALSVTIELRIFLFRISIDLSHWISLPSELD